MKNKLDTLIIFGCILTLVIFLLPITTTNAQGLAPTLEYTLLEPLPCVDNGASGAKCEDGLIKKVNLANYLSVMFKIAIGLAGVFAVFMIVVGGFQYATTDALSGKKEGKEKITRAIEGLLLALVSYFILYTIDPRFVEFRTDLERLNIAEDRRGTFINEELGIIAQAKREEIQKYDAEAAEYRIKASQATTEEEAVDFLIKANELEKKSIHTWAEAVGYQSTQFALDTINKTELAGVRLASAGLGQQLKAVDKEFIATHRTKVANNYDKAINELRVKGDLEGAQKYVDAKKYALFTIDGEMFTKEALLIAEDLDHVSKEERIKRTLTVLKQGDVQFKKEVNDPEFLKKYQEESAVRIKKIEDALKKN